MAVCALNMRQLSKVSGSRGRLINQTIDMILKKLKISKCQKLKASGQEIKLHSFSSVRLAEKEDKPLLESHLRRSSVGANEPSSAASTGKTSGRRAIGNLLHGN